MAGYVLFIYIGILIIYRVIAIVIYLAHIAISYIVVRTASTARVLARREEVSEFGSCFGR